MTFGSLFAGIGGLDIGLERAGMVCKWQCEIDPFCRKVLAKHWPEVKRYGDIRELSGDKLEPVDLICGGFPCQPISLAGRRKAQSDDRWLWPYFIRIIRAVRPRFVLVENTPGLASAGVEEDEGGERVEARGLAMGEVLGDLAASGYDTEWDCIPASAFGANHLRYRVWIVAYPQEFGRGAGRAGRSDPGGAGEREQPLSDADAAPVLGEAVLGSEPNGDVRSVQAPSHADEGRRRGRAGTSGAGRRAEPPNGCHIFTDADITRLQERQEQVMLEQLASAKRNTPNDDGEPLVGAAIARGEHHAWTAEPGVVRMVHGVPNRVDRIRALGNAVVPQVAEFIGRRILEAGR